MILSQNLSAEKLKKLTLKQKQQLCSEIRSYLLDTIAETGGHLSPNLGTVELTVALHSVFDFPNDKIVWDVGHQAYTHKLLTGRYEAFRKLRQKDGISGFPRPSESKYDSFIAGHSSNSISAACGIAKALSIKGDDHSVVAIIGDGAFSGGLAFEGLNNGGKSNTNLIVILNDNEMSISKNTGAMAMYLAQIRSTKRYYNAKKNVKSVLDNMHMLGEGIHRVVTKTKSLVKDAIYHSNWFENLGFKYLGPIDGHNIEELTETLSVAKMMKKPCLVHIYTQKGKGYKPAEENPGEFHAITKKSAKPVSATNFSEEFGKTICALADTDSRICAITAAMKYATGLNFFKDSHKERFFDVGIAEQHAVTFAAGLATEGILPVFAVYSTFLQRSYDQILHDCAIEKTHIILCVDRAGFVGEDGETHQGVFDVSMLSAIPNVTVYSPSSYTEQSQCIKQAIYYTDGIAVVRYQKGAEYKPTHAVYSEFTFDDNGSDVLAVSYGRVSAWLDEAAEACAEKKLPISTLKLLKILPISEEIISIVQKHKSVFFFEEGMKKGGIAQLMCSTLTERGFIGDFHIIAVDGEFVRCASVEQQLSEYGLDKNSMIDTIIGICGGNNDRTTS